MDTQKIERRVYTVEEAGKILGVSRATAYARAADGSIPTVRMGRLRLVPKVALDRMLGGEAA